MVGHLTKLYYVVSEFLNDAFPQHWIGRGGWKAWSHELTVHRWILEYRVMLKHLLKRFKMSVCVCGHNV